MLISDVFLTLFPHADVAYANSLQGCLDDASINSPNRIASFFAQTGVESAGYTRIVENLNYSAAGLLATFPTHFDRATAEAYARQPARIANRAYASRMGNGNEASGDGWKFRGKGLIQITGRRNVSTFAMAANLSVNDCVDYLGTPKGALHSAMWYWTTNGLNALADRADIVGMTKRVNGGLNGLKERTDLFNLALAELAKI